MKQGIGIQSLWKAEHVAKRCSVQRSTVYEWCRQNYVPHIQLGTGHKKPCIRFFPEEIERWLKAKSKQGRSTRIPPIA